MIDLTKLINHHCTKITFEINPFNWLASMCASNINKRINRLLTEPWQTLALSLFVDITSWQTLALSLFVDITTERNFVHNNNLKHIERSLRERLDNRLLLVCMSKNSNIGLLVCQITHTKESSSVKLLIRWTPRQSEDSYIGLIVCKMTPI